MGAPKISRLKLENSHFEDTSMIGLVSAEPDYKLSLSINKTLKISLKNTTPVKINDETGQELVFSRFSDTTAYPDLIFDLISNRSGKEFLLKKLKNVDYIFQILDSENRYGQNQIADFLRKTEFVTALFVIDINTFKDRNFHLLTL
jgi:hypothetical protein